MGLDVRMIWIRNRIEFEWENIKVYLDSTEGYGKIIELELHTEDKDKVEIIERILKNKLSSLGIDLTPREEFEKKFQEYEKNWKYLIKDKLKEMGLEELLS